MNQFEVDSISMAFGLKQVLSGARIEAAQGDIIGILGRNGCGKSTLYRCLLGLYRNASATMHIDGRYISRANQLGYFGYLPQESFLPYDYPIYKSMKLLLEARDIVRYIEQDERMRGLLKRRGGKLSFGERRYAECLIILSLDRSITLLDEPFSQIEPIYCEVLARYIKKSAEGRAVLVCDHLYRNVQATCNRLMILREGRLWSVENNDQSLREYGYIEKSETP